MLSNKPIVSVIVLAYNHVETIDQCLEGVLAQEFEGTIEVIVGEDDSHDGTREKCQAWALRYPDKINLLLGHREDNILINGKPTGVGNWLRCLDSCRGKYLAFCEGDDYWIDPLKISRQVKVMQSCEDVVIFYHRVMVERSGSLISDENSITELRYRRTGQTRELGLDAMIRLGNFIHTASVMIRRDRLVRREYLRHSVIGDYLNYLIVLSAGGWIEKIDGPAMAVYREGHGSFSGQSYHMKLLDQMSCLSVALTLPLSTEHKHVLLDRLNELRSELSRYTLELKNKEPGWMALVLFSWRKVIRRLGL